MVDALINRVTFIRQLVITLDWGKIRKHDEYENVAEIMKFSMEELLGT